MALALPFGRYVLLEKLATGGMAELFLAKAVGEAGFERTCVIKRVLPHLAADPQFIAMFLDEARIAARLNHPGIVQVFDLGREGEDYYFAMEYLPGQDLAQVLAEARKQGKSIPVNVALAVMAEAADALHYAHEFKVDASDVHGVVHRDVSLSNLFLTGSGHVRVLDFGIARAQSRLQSTSTGQIKGKTAYMSPEQLRGKGVDRRTDLWALGICLYELLAGERPFQGDSMPQIALAVCEQPMPDLSARRPELPAGVVALVARLLDKDASRRLSTALELRDALRALLAELGGPPDLSVFMLALFGEERLAARGVEEMRAPSTGTPVLEQGMPLTDTDITPTRRRRWGLLALGAAVLGALAGVGMWQARLPARVQAPPISTETQGVDAGSALPRLAQTPVEAPPEVDAGLAVDAGVAVDPVVPLPPTELASHRRTRRAGTTLAISANVPVEVFLDGKRLGRAPLNHVSATPGSHLLRLENRELRLTHVSRILVRANIDNALALMLGKGKLTVDVAPWADVFLDGAKLGQTPLAGREVWEGAHTVKLTSPAGEKVLHVNVQRDRTVVVNETLP